MTIIKKLILLLTPQERVTAGLLLFMITIMAILDMIGVASILPFIAVLTNPSLIETNEILNFIYRSIAIFGVYNHQHFLFALGLIVFFLLVISQIFKMFTTYAQLRFVQMREYSIGKRLLERYLSQPYSWFLGRHSSDIGKTILSEVQQLINDGMFSLIELIARGMVVIAIIMLLVLTDPKLVFIIGTTLASSYLIIFYFIRNFISQIGKLRLENNEMRFKNINEAFGATKEIKIRGLETFYIKRFTKSAKIYARTQALSKVISTLPRFILEIIAFGGILLIILYFLSKSGDISNALPVLSLYVFAGYRLMPSLQQIYASFTNITFVAPSLNKIFNDINNLEFINQNNDQMPMIFNKTIKLNNVYYTYPSSSHTALTGININIPAKSKIGIIGMTGCGKTTTIDIILGLLRPQKGSLEVDGQIISSENLRSWQMTIGYVPQHIYLSDDTIASNIAFGVNPNKINYQLLEKAARTANLHSFVMDELPKQYQTRIGENGVRLSGGQRQRIGIARALYNKPSVLILDEATSALDNQTEIAVMEALNNLDENITTILIAHRLSTVQNCDKIFLLEKGKIKKEGKFQDLIDVH